MMGPISVLVAHFLALDSRFPKEPTSGLDFRYPHFRSLLPVWVPPPVLLDVLFKEGGIRIDVADGSEMTPALTSGLKTDFRS